ncbi:MAG: type II toxin-antitoxin system VapC family toxin [Anaerolineae bacterium]|nr:type II toxin-antitoxin system VapC family toxin [Anaerolineae bacterium]
MTVVLDTSALIYWTLDPDKLSASARAKLAETDRIVISSISIWEIGLKVSKRQLSIPISIENYAERLLMVQGVEVMPVDTETWLANLGLDWSHRDPADRTIVATAMLLNAPLLTSDRTIRQFYPQAIW